MAVEIGIIKKVRLFNSLDEAEQRQLAKASNLLNYRDRDEIFSEGAEGKELFIVNNGTVNIVKKIGTTMGENETQTLANLRSGEYFGEFTFFLGGIHSASAVAEGDVSILVLDRSDFNQIAQDDPMLGYTIMKEITIYMGELLREMNKKFAKLVGIMWNGKR